MSNNVIPVYSEGDHVGALAFEPNGKMLGIQLNEVGSKQCQAIIKNQLEFVLDLKPTNSALLRIRGISGVLEHDERVRAEAVKLAGKVAERTNRMFPESEFILLCENIEKFLKGD